MNPLKIVSCGSWLLRPWKICFSKMNMEILCYAITSCFLSSLHLASLITNPIGFIIKLNDLNKFIQFTVNCFWDSTLSFD